MQKSEGYCSFELVGSEEELIAGQTYTFRACISKEPPPFYTGDPVLVESLPEKPGVCVLCPDLRHVNREANQYVPMVFEGDGLTATATFELQAEGVGDTILFAQFYHGRKPVLMLQLELVIRERTSSPDLVARGLSDTGSEC